MYNKLHFKRNSDGRIEYAFHGDLVAKLISIRHDVEKKDGGVIRCETLIDEKEVDKLIEYLEEFKRLLKEAR